MSTQLTAAETRGAIHLNHDKWPKPPRKVGNRWLYGTTLFWAENGAVYLEETHPDKHGTATRQRQSMVLRKWVERFRAVADAYRHQYFVCQQTGNIAKQASAIALRDALRGLMEAMKHVALEAKTQGDICDPNVQRYYDNHVVPVKRTHLVTHQISANEKKTGLILPH